MPFYTRTAFAKGSFALMKDSLAQGDELPLAEVVDEAVFQKAFDDHQVDFGSSEDAVYTPAITLWALISQVFFAKENRSCTAAVMRIALLWAKRGRRICDTNNGDYCRARLKIPFEAVRQITRAIAKRVEMSIDLQAINEPRIVDQEQLDARSERQLAPDVVARCKIPAKVGRVLMIDGFTVATTILDRSNYRSQWIASIYRGRWFVELDIRSMKESLNMDNLRAKSPAMVLTKLWSCLLAYNLIRMKMLQSGITMDRDVRSMSFVQTMAFLACGWVLLAATGTDAMATRLGQTACVDTVVGHRPDRYEPRVNKRRPKVLALMAKPRAMYHAEVAANVAA